MNVDRLQTPDSSMPVLARCAGLSLAIHVGAVIVLGLFQLSSVVQKVPDKIMVQLLQSPPVAPPQKVSPSSTTPLVTPQMKVVSRTKVKNLVSRTPLATTILPTPERRPASALSIDSRKPLPDKALPVSETRRPLLDNRAHNALNAKEFVKMIPARSTRKGEAAQQGAVPTRQPSLLTSPVSTVPVSIERTESGPKESTKAKSAPVSRRKLTMELPSGTGKIGKSGAKLARSTPPIYPRVAREEGWEGTVVLRVQLHMDGIPKRVTIKKTSGHEVLDQAAVKAVYRWRFSPAKDGNIPFSSLVDIPVRFDLTNG